MWAFRSNAEVAADAYCSAIEMNRLIGIEGSTVIAEFLDLHCRDDKWIAPHGRDLTDLCNMSATGGFESEGPWTLNGWVLDERSMDRLRAEFPHEFAAR